MKKVRHVNSVDNSVHVPEPHNSDSRWSRIVAGVAVGASSITTLAITGSMEHATAVALLVMFPLKGSYGTSSMPAVRLHLVRVIRRAYCHGTPRPRHNSDDPSCSGALEQISEAD
jgi:hypothetical protein